MDIKNLITFIHVAELNSFTKAGELLGYSQSSVSFQTKQLEEELDAQLFERIRHTIALTDKGREVLSYAHQIHQLTKEMENQMHSKQQICGHIRLAMADSLCDSLLGEGYEEFRRKYPGITLKIIAAGTKEMFRLMNHNEVDAILTLDNHIYNTEYVIAREEQVQIHFVAGKDHPLCQRESLSVKDLIGESFLLTEKGMSYRRILDDQLAGMSLEIQPILEIGSTRLICDLVEQGNGISVLPDYVTDRGVQEGRLAYLNVCDLHIQVWKQLLYHKDKWISPQMKSVLAFCMEREFHEKEG